MVTVIIQHEVKDFAAWKAIFDGDEPNRTKAGVTLAGLYTSMKNPNDATIIFEIPSMEIFDKMMNNPDMQETMKKAGVISAPNVSILKKV